MLILDASNSSQTDGPVTSGFVTLTVGVGINTCVFVVTIVKASSPSPTATYGGVAMTKIGEIDDTVETIAAFYLVNPPTGTNNADVSWTNNGSCKILARSYFGIHKGVPVLPASLTTALTPNGSISVPSLPGDIVLDAIGYSTNYASACTPGAGQTLVMDLHSSGSALHGAASAMDANQAGITTTMSWTAPTSAGAHLGFSVHASPWRTGVAISPSMIF